MILWYSRVLEFGACGTQSVVGTAGFVSPERLEGHMYDTKVFGPRHTISLDARPVQQSAVVCEHASV